MYHGWNAAKASGDAVEPLAVLEAAFEGVTKEKAVLAGAHSLASLTNIPSRSVLTL